MPFQFLQFRLEDRVALGEVFVLTGQLGDDNGKVETGKNEKQEGKKEDGRTTV